MVISLFEIFIAYLIALSMGYGISYLSFKEKFRDVVLHAAPIIGFGSYCLFTIVLSGILNIGSSIAGWVIFTVLIISSIVIIGKNKIKIQDEFSTMKVVGVFILVMFVMCLWSVIYQGTDLYLGTVNPDLYQSLSFLDALNKYNLPFFSSINVIPEVLKEPFPSAFPTALQARFGAVVFAQLLGALLFIDDRTSLVTLISFALLLLPSSIYIFTNLFLKMKPSSAVISGLLVAIASPYAMSLLHGFVGQNTGLPFLTFCLATLVIAIDQKSIKLLGLSALMLNALFFIYVMMIPYILAPVFIYIVYLIITENKDQKIWLIKFIGISLLITLLIHLTIISYTSLFIKDLLGLLGGMYQSHYYIDFLTEFVIVYATGVTSYPWIHNTATTGFGPVMAAWYLVLAGLIIIFYFYILKIWAKETNRKTVVLQLITLSIYIAVWFYYTFVKLYGYAPFKMSVWLYFMVIPFMGFAISSLYNLLIEKNHKSKFQWLKISYMTGMLSIFITTNVVASIDYSLKSFGRDQKHGSIINAYGIGGNSQYIDIKSAINKYTEEDQHISLGLPDLMSNEWAAYYLYAANRHLISASSHWLFPDDEAFMPNLESGLVSDVRGIQTKDYRPFRTEGVADFYLMPSDDNLNRDITQNGNKQTALWENGVVRLVEAKNAKDLLLTGRGFYRSEFVNQDGLQWWFPREIRWSAEGGEFLHINPSNIGKPTSLSFVAIVGYGISEDFRNVDIYHNGKLIDTRTINGAARIVTKPYIPVSGVNTLVVRVREKTFSIKRQYGIWHKDIPHDWRKLNIAFSDVNLVNAPGSENKSEQLTYKDLFNTAVEFNGFNVDGWMMNMATFSLDKPKLAKSIKMNIFIPGAPTYKFPYDIKFNINDVEIKKSFDHPGQHEISVSLDAIRDANKINIGIQPSQQVSTPAVNGGRRLTQSMKLENISFSNI